MISGGQMEKVGILPSNDHAGRDPKPPGKAERILQGHSPGSSPGSEQLISSDGKKDNDQLK